MRGVDHKMGLTRSLYCMPPLPKQNAGGIWQRSGGTQTPIYIVRG